MATTFAEVATPISGRGFRLFKWTTVSSGDTIPSLIVGEYQDVTIWFLKATAFGGNMGAEGTPNPDSATARWVTLKDPGGTAIATLSAEAVRVVLDGAYAIRPTAGAGAANVDVWAVCRQPG